jgi:hypothetical protein
MSRLALALVFAAAGRAAAQPSTTHGPVRYVAGKLPFEETLLVERIAPDGGVIEVFRGGVPSAWRWLDAHTLIELFDEHSKGDAVIAWIVDGRPDPTHAITIDNTAWPAEAQAWSQYLATSQGQLWLVREPEAGRTSAKAKTKAKAKADKPVYQRLDVTPHVVQRDPPAGVVAARDEGRAWFNGLPSVTPPKAIKLTRARARIGKRTVGTVQCKPDKGATTTFPDRSTQPFLRIDVNAVRFVSPTLPLYLAGGMAAERPEGAAFDTAAFLGCTKEPLHTLAWAGGDVFLTIDGAPGRAGFSADDPRKMQLWVDGRTVANLGVLLSPRMAPSDTPRAP